MKSNIGHCQAASGIASVIKMVLALQHGVLPQTLHVDQPSTNVDWSVGAVELLTERRDWPEIDRPRRVGVSSFGVSGTNAHVILEQAPAIEDEAAEPRATPVVVPWVLSGKSEQAVRDQAARLAGVDAPLEDIGLSLVTTRSVFEHRAVVVGSSAELAAVNRRRPWCSARPKMKPSQCLCSRVRVRSGLAWVWS
jgi:acyl transferase domain-containing protein